MNIPHTAEISFRLAAGLIAFGLFTAGLTACKGDQDVVAPSVDSVTVDGVALHASVATGTDFSLEMQFSDDVDLREYKVDIHDNFDGHSHGKIAVVPWSYIEIAAISGRQVTEQLSISVPVDAAAGPYDLLVRVLDEAGNEGAFSALELTLTNDEMPTISITAPDPFEYIEASPGGSISLSGKITDETDLDEITIELAQTGERPREVAETPLYDEDWDLPAANDTLWDFATLASEGKLITIPPDAATGQYLLRISASDSEGNYNVSEAVVQVED